MFMVYPSGFIQLYEFLSLATLSKGFSRTHGETLINTDTCTEEKASFALSPGDKHIGYIFPQPSCWNLCVFQILYYSFILINTSLWKLCLIGIDQRFAFIRCT